MGNLTCVAAQTRPGDEVIADTEAHVVVYEVGGTAIVAGVQLRLLDSVDGIPDAQVDHRRGARERHPPAGLQPPLHREHAQPQGRRGASTSTRIARAPRALRTPSDSACTATAPGCSTPRSRWASTRRHWWTSATRSRLHQQGARCTGRVGRRRRRTGHRRRAPVAQASRGRHASGGSHRSGRPVRARAQRRAACRGPRQREAHRRARSPALPARRSARPAVPTNIVIFETRASATELAAGLARDGVLVSVMGPHTLRCVTHLDVDATAMPPCRRHPRARARRVTLDTRKAPGTGRRPSNNEWSGC